MFCVGINLFPFLFQGAQVLLFPQQASSLSGNHLKAGVFYFYIYLSVYVMVILWNFVELRIKLLARNKNVRNIKGSHPFALTNVKTEQSQNLMYSQGQFYLLHLFLFFLLQNPIKCLLKSRNLRKKSWKCLHLWWNTGLVFWAASHQTTAVLDGKKRKRSWYTRNPSQMHHLDLQAFNYW